MLKVETISRFSFTKQPRIMEMSFLSGAKRLRSAARSFLFILFRVSFPWYVVAVYHNNMTGVLWAEHPDLLLFRLKKDVQTGRINLDSHLWKETDNTSRIVFYFFSAARRKDVLIPA